MVDRKLSNYGMCKWMGGLGLWLGVIAVIILVGAEAQAQGFDRQSAQKLERSRYSSENHRRPSTSAQNLPDWAEPSTSSPQKPSYGKKSEASTRGPNLPPTPTVPVDGGLLWLVLAGGGYATWKLREPNGA